MKSSFIKRQFSKAIILLLVGISMIGCNKDEEITGQAGLLPPVITLDNSSALYSVKISTPFTITPEVENGDGAIFSWKLEGKIISDEQILQHTIHTAGEHYITLRVDNRTGSDEVEILVDVSAKALPLISFVEPASGLEVVAAKDYIFSPDVQNAENASFRWTLNGIDVGQEKEYTFNQTELGSYTLTFHAENEDGEDEVTLNITVVESLPISIVFPPSYLYMQNPLVKTLAVDRKLCLQPFISNIDNPSYKWYIDGAEQAETAEMLVFTPTEAGRKHEIKLVVTDNAGAQTVQLSRNMSRSEENRAEYTLTVETYGPENTLLKNTTGKAEWNKVYEFLPAPGQFVNNTTAGYELDETTMEKAIAYAEGRLLKKDYVSLGAFGGYIIVGFDHSIQNKGGYDFSIVGNQFEGSSEPGVVWVMQDTNGNGLPDDEWYELKGSEYGKEETWQNYAITYYRPASTGAPIRWKDNRGYYGAIDATYYAHGYYPLWIENDSYTLYGTRLQDRTTQIGGNGIWVNAAFDWGYADNVGSDADKTKNHFRISDAVYLDGTPANLQFIDFIKVHTAVNKTAGRIGEVSTEVVNFKDENLQ